MEPRTPEGENPSFDVGTPKRPLVARGPSGPLWKATPPRSGTHGRGRLDSASASRAPAAFARLISVRQVPDGAGPEDLRQGRGRQPSIATRAAVLTTAQATGRLGARCRRLLKVRRPSTLSRIDRKRRTACIAERRALVAASKQDPTQAPPTSVQAPSAPIQGPQPPRTGPTPTLTATPTTTPGAVGAPPTPTPTPTPAGPDPSTVQCGAVGLTALDVDPLKPFAMSRAVACTSASGVVNFELRNTDSQVHNLGVQLPGRPSTLVPVLTNVPQRTSQYANVALSPGTYEVVCMIVGHGVMTVRLTVLSKEDYIAQGYAG